MGLTASKLVNTSLYYAMLALGRKHIVLRPCSKALGDNLMLSMLAREIKHAYPRLKVCIETYRPELFSSNPNVDLVLPGKLALRHIKLSYKLDQSTNEHILDQLVRLLPFQIDNWERRLDLFLDNKRHKHLNAKLPQEFIAVCPSGKQRHAANRKEWGFEHFQNVLDQLPETPFVQIGYPNDPVLRNAIDMRHLGILDMAYVLKRATTAVILEGGLMHMSNSVQGKAIVIFGGANRPEYLAYPEHIAVATSVDCGPCFNSKIPMRPCTHLSCMDSIAPTLIVELIRSKAYINGGIVRA